MVSVRSLAAGSVTTKSRFMEEHWAFCVLAFYENFGLVRLFDAFSLPNLNYGISMR